MWGATLLVMPGRVSERLLRASLRLGKRVAHGLGTPVLAALGRLRAPRRQAGADRLPPGCARTYMDSSPAAESFRDLLLRHRGRSGLTQRELANRAGANRRTVQDWEAGVNYPSAELLQALIQALLAAGGLTAGHEAAEAQDLWAAVLRDAPRMHTPFDELWLAMLLRERAT